MDQVSQFLAWLFGTRQGVIWLIAGGVVISLIVAIILERRGREIYYNHELTEEDEGSIFSVFESDDEDAQA